MPTKIEIARARARVSVARLSGEVLPDEVIERAKLDFSEAEPAPSAAEDVAPEVLSRGAEGSGAAFRRHSTVEKPSDVPSPTADAVEKMLLDTSHITRELPTVSSQAWKFDTAAFAAITRAWDTTMVDLLTRGSRESRGDLDITRPNGVARDMDYWGHDPRRFVLEITPLVSGDTPRDVDDDEAADGDAPLTDPR